jgi:NADH dehydrogenase
MNKTKIVIVGGGFGGVYTARNLLKLFGDRAEITIINKNNYFLFTPLLHEVATGALTPQSVVESLREVFRGTPVVNIEDTVTEIDRVNKIVKTSHSNYSYDYLVISSGAETNYFGIPGAQENSFTLKNLNDAISLRNHIIETFEKASESNCSENLSFAIVGAGATGVELAAELAEYVKETLHSYYNNSKIKKEDIKISIITNTSQVISVFPEKMRVLAQKSLESRGISVITNTTVSKVENGQITLADSTTIKAHTIIWVAGVKPSLSSIKGIDVGQKGRMDTNEFLQNINDPTIFGLGDASGNLPMLAQIAVQQAKTVAYNIYAHKSGLRLNKFETKIKGLLISLGQWNALGNFHGLTLSGPVMWFIWRTVYLFNFNSWKRRLEIAIEWTVNLFYPRDITYLK